MPAPARVTPSRQDLGGAVGVEGVGQDQRVAEHQAGEQPGDAADVGEGEHQRGTVVLDDRQASTHAPGHRGDRRVGVLGALRLGGRARRVEDPAHRLVGHVEGFGPIRQPGGVALGQRPVADEDPHVAALTLGDRQGHRLVVEALPARRDHQQPAVGLVGDEVDLAVAQDRQDRVLHDLEPAERRDQDQRLDPGRKLPGDDVSGSQTRGLEPRRGPLRFGPQLGEGQRPHVLVDGHQGVGGGLGASLHQLPERPTFDHVRLLSPAPGARRGPPIRRGASVGKRTRPGGSVPATFRRAARRPGCRRRRR